MDLQAEMRLSLLFIAHDLAVVRHIKHRIQVMYLGRVAEVADHTRSRSCATSALTWCPAMKPERLLSVALALLCLGLALPGDARAEPARFELTPFAAYRLGGKFRPDPDTAASDLRDGSGFGLGAGWYRDPESLYELLYSRRTAGLDNADPALRGVDVSIEYLHFGGTLLLPQPHGGSGWVSATVGLTRLDASPGGYSSERKFSGSMGGGYRIPLAANLDAVLGVRVWLTLVDSDSRLVCASIDGVGQCLIRVSSSSFWELEGLAGLSFRF